MYQFLERLSVRFFTFPHHIDPSARVSFPFLLLLARRQAQEAEGGAAAADDEVMDMTIPPELVNLFRYDSCQVLALEAAVFC